MRRFALISIRRSVSPTQSATTLISRKIIQRRLSRLTASSSGIAKLQRHCITFHSSLVTKNLRPKHIMTQPKTLYEKLWESHLVAESDDAPSILYIDLHLIHEVTSPQAFSALREKGLKARRPERTIATMDHSTPTISLDYESADEMAVIQLNQINIKTINCCKIFK